MIHRFALALFAFLLVLGLNLSTPQVAHAQDTEASLVVNLRNLPVTGAAAVLTSSFTPTQYGGFGQSVAYRAQVGVVGTDSTFEVDFGTDVAPLKFNKSEIGTLTAGYLYTFTFEATTSDEVNFTFGTSTTVVRLTVTAIRGGVM